MISDNLDGLELIVTGRHIQKSVCRDSEKCMFAECFKELGAKGSDVSVELANVTFDDKEVLIEFDSAIASYIAEYDDGKFVYPLKIKIEKTPIKRYINEDSYEDEASLLEEFPDANSDVRGYYLIDVMYTANFIEFVGTDTFCGVKQ